jgi:hypothetical protein
MRNPITLLRESPEYILGRFHLVRVTYSRVRKLEQSFSSVSPPLYIGEKYGPDLARLAPAQSAKLTSDVSAGQHVERLRRSAISEGITLSPETCDELLAIGQSHALEGVHHKSVTYEELERSPSLRRNEAILAVSNASALEPVRSIAGECLLVDVAAAYLGYSPARVSAWLFWSLRNEMTLAEREANYQTIRFHYDVHGLNFLYVNFYLTPTDARSGAHVMIEASHRRKSVRRLFGTARLNDTDAVRDYGQRSLRTISGPPGTGFFEDASCYHKALAPIEHDRFMLQLRFQ